MNEYKVAIVGASGLVGREMIKVLEERNFPIAELRALASEKSAGGTLRYKKNPVKIEKLEKDSFHGFDFALFSAGGSVSAEFAPIAADSGCVAIDNSSAWRLDEEVPLVVPEVNPTALERHNGIIANPNCSTIQLAVALKPIADKFGLKRVICSTYQSISGAGQKGVEKLNEELSGGYRDPSEKRIAYGWLFHPFEENGSTVEENKLIDETRKIFDLPELKIAVTCVRLPILGGHGEAVNVETEKPFEIEEVSAAFEEFRGLIVLDDPNEDEYPTPRITRGRDEVFVGRIRRDRSAKNGLAFWVAADNLRKGAATNAVQIAEGLFG